MPTATQNDKLLIVYYSFSGITQSIAERLREKTSAVLYAIETAEPYNKHTLVDVAKKELEQKRLPALKYPVPSMAAYDTILVGGPVWWYTVATPVMKFLEQADFAGKKTAAFCTHEGGVGTYFEDFQKQAKNAHVLPGIDLFSPNRRGSANAEKACDAWLSSLGLLSRKV